MMDDEYSNHSFQSALRDLRTTMGETRDRVIEISSDLRWIKEESDSFETECTRLWTAIDDIKQRISLIEIQQTGLKSAISTAASIISMLISIGVAVYVGFWLR